MRLAGAATFLRVPQLARVLEGVAPGTRLQVPLANLSYIDHACMELLEDWGGPRSDRVGPCRSSPVP